MSTGVEDNSPTFPSDWNDFVFLTACGQNIPHISNGLCSSSSHDSTACSCDPSCSTYGDCCIDIAANTSKSDTIKWVCGEVNAGREEFVVASCLSHWNNSDISTYCKMPNLHISLYDAPYYSSKKGFYYANVYCAICNDDFDDESIVQIACPRGSFSSEEQFSSLEYNYFASQFHRVGSRSNDRYCRTISSKPVGVDKVEPGRKCRRSVATCGWGWTDDDVLQLCRSYKYEVYTSSGNVYKNFHCARCNREQISDISCTSNDTITTSRDTETEKSESVMFAFGLKLRYRMDQLDDGYCGLDQIFVPSLKVCASVICPDGYRWSVKRCILDSSKPDTIEDQWQEYTSEFQSKCNSLNHSLPQSTLSDDDDIHTDLRNVSSTPEISHQYSIGYCQHIDSIGDHVTVSVTCQNQINQAYLPPDSENVTTTNFSVDCSDCSCSKIFIVNRCPSDWTDDKIKSFCESLDTPELSTPESRKAMVYSKMHGYFYENIYCAQCHGDIDDSTVNITCFDRNRTVNHDVKDHLTYPVIYNETLRSYDVIVTDNATTLSNCYAMVSAINLFKIQELENVRFCEPTGSNCATWTSISRLKDACDSRYMDFKVTITTPSTVYECFVFKSPGEGKQRLLCKQTGRYTVFHAQDRSATIFLDISTPVKSGNLETDSGVCKSDEYFDAVLKICLKVTCPKGQTWKNDKCA